MPVIMRMAHSPTITLSLCSLLEITICNLYAKSGSHFRSFLPPPLIWSPGSMIYFRLCQQLVVFITDESINGSITLGLRYREPVNSFSPSLSFFCIGLSVEFLLAHPLLKTHFSSFFIRFSFNLFHLKEHSTSRVFCFSKFVKIFLVTYKTYLT